MIVQFTFKVYGNTQEEAAEEMDEVTSKFLSVFPGLWECIEDALYIDPAWIPGEGPTGNIKGYKAYRRFIPSTDEGGGDYMEETPQETPVETVQVEDNPQAPETPEEAQEAAEETPEEAKQDDE